MTYLYYKDIFGIREVVENQSFFKIVKNDDKGCDIQNFFFTFRRHIPNKVFNKIISSQFQFLDKFHLQQDERTICFDFLGNRAWGGGQNR
jgi:hypothetical protein